MDGMLWQLVVANLLTPNAPFIFPWRMAATAEAATVYPWWIVLSIANLCGAIGMIPVYALARWFAADSWHQRIERYPVLQQLRHRWRSNMFVVQICMNATPLPDVVSSGLAGCERYPLWKFMLSQILGRSFHNVPLILGGALLGRFPWFQKLMTFITQPLVMIAIVLVTALIWLLHARSKPQPQAVE